jgi:hypothetical protein
MTHETSTFAQLAESLGGEWTAERVEAKAPEFEASDAPIHITRSGVECFGCETGTKPGLYKAVRRGIDAHSRSSPGSRLANQRDPFPTPTPPTDILHG